MALYSFYRTDKLIITILFNALLIVTLLPSYGLSEININKSVVKIITVQSVPFEGMPWVKVVETGVTGSGFLVSNKRILTNAHVVSNQTVLQVVFNGGVKKYPARVVAVSHEADIAILSIDDNTFFEDTTPLILGELPELQDEVSVYGFPEGGDSLSITQGVVSRIEHSAYVHSSKKLLSVQIDAAINSGNSGGPVISDGKVVGIATQTLQDSENIGYIIPPPVISHFLKDIEDGNLDGFPEIGIICQGTENKSLTKMYGLVDGQSGVLVIYIYPGSSADGILKKKDIILTVNNHTIADDGSVEFRPNGRTNWSYYIQQHQVGEKIVIEFMRNGEKHIANIFLGSRNTPLVPREQYDKVATYYIFGGLVFRPLTKHYLMMSGEDWLTEASPQLLNYLYSYPKIKGQQIVNLISVLPNKINNGYHSFSDTVIMKVNGSRINNLKQMIKLIEKDTTSPFVEFETINHEYIVLDRELAEKNNEKILKTYSIPQDRSVDLM